MTSTAKATNIEVPKFVRFVPKTPKAWVAVGAIIFLFSVLSNIPPTWGARVLTNGTGLGLSGLSGSAFDGRASSASVRIGERDYALGSFRWTFKWTSLLSLSPCLAIQTDAAQQRFSGDVCVSSGNRVTIKDADVSLPLGVIKHLIPLQVDGLVSGSISQAVLKDGALDRISASLQWGQAKAFNGVTWMDMGNFGATVKDAGESFVAQVVSLDGPVEADINLDFVKVGGINVKGTLVLQQSFIDQTYSSGLLAMIGQATQLENNQVRYDLDTSF